MLTLLFLALLVFVVMVIGLAMFNLAYEWIVYRATGRHVMSPLD